MPILYQVDQNSDDWDRLRLGIPTASEFKKILTPAGKLSKQADKYMMKLLAEWYFGGPLEDPQTQYQSEWMERGHFLEQQAVDSFELEWNVATIPGGFVTTDDGRVGCSPDRLIGDDGVLEIKNPSPTNHMKFMVERSVDDEHYPQVQGQLYICERQYAAVVSHCPAFPDVIIRVPRDEEYIGHLADALLQFNEKLDQFKTVIEKQYGRVERTPEKGIGFVDNQSAIGGQQWLGGRT